MPKYRVTIKEVVLHEVFVEATNLQEARLIINSEDRFHWEEVLGAGWVETGDVIEVGTYCFDCGWEDSNHSFFTEVNGKFYCSIHFSKCCKSLSTWKDCREHLESPCYETTCDKCHKVTWAECKEHELGVRGVNV
jgi:hypothetical protein